MSTTDKWKHQIQAQIDEWKADYHEFMADRDDDDWDDKYNTADEYNQNLQDDEYNWDDKARDQLESWWLGLQSDWKQFKAKNL